MVVDFFVTERLCAPISSAMQDGLPDGLHLVTSCENSQYQPVQVGSNAADVSAYVCI